ncbi:kinase-like protein [Aspergillus pseudonomiae]|nr:kinase-like protein [Aspergillus pseudonomiae]
MAPSVIRTWKRMLREFSQLSYPLLDPTEKLEEETLPWYQVIGKLGYGGYSTVWLCRDLQQHEYVTLKVFERNSTEGQRETETYRHLNSLDKVDHTGAKLIRTALDNFHITSQEGKFRCLTRSFPKKIVKLTLMHLLLALDYLHTEAGIVHTDIQEKNIMMAIEDTSILADFEEEEKSRPSPRKRVGDRVIYTSRKLRKTKQHGRPTLCDFGQAHRGTSTYYGDIQPYIYRAPEVLLRKPWNEKVDIWNVGLLVCLIVNNMGSLPTRISGRDSDKKRSDGHRIAEMIAVMGPPPKEMIPNSVYATEFLDDEGSWKGAIEIPLMSLETLEGNLEGEPRLLFFQFPRKMLKWKAEDRLSSRELLEDPWLRSP